MSPPVIQELKPTTMHTQTSQPYPSKQLTWIHAIGQFYEFQEPAIFTYIHSQKSDVLMPSK